MEPKNQQGSVQAVTNALRLLECFAGPEEDVPLGELARRTGLSKSTAHRLLATLVHEGYLAQDGREDDYRLGSRLLRFANYARSRSELLRLARPILQRLVRDVDETSMIGVLDGDRLLYLDTIEPTNAVRLTRLPGTVDEPHVSSLGKVLLAHTSPAVLEAILSKQLPPRTAQTLTEPGRFRTMLDTVRESGFAINDQERFDGVRAVGVPVFDEHGDCVAALSVAGPVQRMDAARIARELHPAVSAAALDLSLRLGFHGELRRTQSVTPEAVLQRFEAGTSPH
jgi:DNA-binding IclR family transcriptional regulator